MPSLDIAMPIALFVVVTVSMILNKRVQGKLMATVEQKEFKLRDILLLVAFISIAITAIALTTMYAPGQIFQNILMIVFLGSYTMLLFTFSYVFSKLTKMRAQLISAGFGVATLIAALTSLLGPLSDSYSIYRAIAFFALAGFCFGATIFEQRKTIENKSRWYVAAQPPALFVLLFVFFNFLYDGTLQVWYPILMDVFGFTFAILIILYLSSMFSWKTVGLFAILLTTLDIILVIGTGTMVVAAKQFTGLGLPVLVYLPNVPFVYSTTGALLSRGLGLGDFFFAGVLAVQTFNKFGKKTAFIAAVAMAVAFGIWEAFLPDIITGLIPIVGRNIQGFPGTLMIISGWAPIVALKLLISRNKTTKLPIDAEPTEAAKEQSLPIQ
jgi:hypothetical protein